ncbi:MAG TPA: antitoxin [Jatrophihabitans sp.]|nr:antitoxin [Jatrophihabitans sp.]
MVDFDELRAKTEDFLEEHADQVDSGIDKAADFATKKYGHAQQIDKGAGKLKEFLPGNDAEEAAEERHEDERPGRGAGQHAPGKAAGGQGRPGRSGRTGQPGRPDQQARRGPGRRPGPGH